MGVSRTLVSKQKFHGPCNRSLGSKKAIGKATFSQHFVGPMEGTCQSSLGLILEVLLEEVIEI